MTRFGGEKDALEMVRKIGDKWGYGNCIQYLSHAWADKLLPDMRKYCKLKVKCTDDIDACHGCRLAAAHGGLLEGEAAEAYANGFNVTV